MHRKLRIGNTLCLTALVGSLRSSARSLALRDILAAELLAIDGIYLISVLPMLIAENFIDTFKRDNDTRTLVTAELNSPHVTIVFQVSTLLSTVLILAEQGKLIAKPMIDLTIGRQIQNQIAGLHIWADDNALVEAVCQI